MESKSEKVVELKPAPEVIEVDAELRSTLVLAFARRRAARAELGEAQAHVERLIEKLDKDGALSAAIRNAGTLVKAYNDAELKLNEVVISVQKAAGVNITGYCIDPESGALKKAPQVIEQKPISLEPLAPRPVKKAKGKSKKR